MTENIYARRHALYTTHQSIWQKCQDARDGEDAVKAAGETYLPKLGGQNDDQYSAYKMRSRYHNAFAKTVNGYVGLSMRKPIQRETPEGLNPVLDNIDRTGSDLSGYVKRIIDQILEKGRCGTLIDHSNVDEAATLQDAGGERPYWIFYDALDILDWEYEDGVLVYCLVRELIPGVNRTVSSEERYRYRELKLEEGVYIQSVYIGTNTEPDEIITPMMNGSPLPFIPFIIHQATFEQTILPPPLIDLVNLCMSYYRLKADHMHALHWVALPTPYITGIDSEEAPKTIGPESIWHISATDAQVGMLEFTGTGVGAIKEELDSMKDEMAVLGARILLPETSEKTATASTLRSISETSDLGSIVVVQSQCITWLLRITSEWNGTGSEAEATIPKDFLPKDLDAGMITALVGAWQSEAFGRSTLVKNFKDAEIIDEEMTMEDLMKEVDEESEERARKAADAMKALADASPDDDSNGPPDGSGNE